MRDSGKARSMAVLLVFSGLVAVFALSYAVDAVTPLYLAVHGWVGALPGLTQIADGGLIAGGLLFCAVAWQCRGPDLRAFSDLLAGGVGAVVAYVASEVLKQAVAQGRPCRAVAEVAELIAECPPVGDWSFPSNHATIGFALAAALAAARPAVAWAALPLAAVVAFARVAAGVHYPHDVIAGAVLGVSLAGAAILVLGGPVAQLLWWLCERYPLGSLLLRRSKDPAARSTMAP